MKILLLVLSFFFFSFSDGDYTLLDGIPFKQADFLTTDNLGNAYVIVGNQLLQFDKTGKPKANYSESTLGEFRSLDVSDPLKLLLFYPDFGRIILLNAQLSVQSTIHLSQIGIAQATIACGSEYGGYWVFDRQDFQLKKVDLNLQTIYQSGDMLSLTGINVNPNFMIENNGFVYMNDPLNGILVFDRYGTYFKTLTIKAKKSFQIIENELLYLSHDTLKAYHLRTQAEREILLPMSSGIKCARIESRELYLLTNDSLAFYSF